MILLQLLWAFIQVGAFSFGGGYAALPLIEEQVVRANQWLTAQEFTDIITISQMTPGPIAINSASFVGIRMGGIAGTAVATFGCILPSLVIVLLLSYFFFKYRNLRGQGSAARRGGADRRLWLWFDGQRAVGQQNQLPFGYGGLVRRGPFCRGAVCFAQMEAQPHLCDAGLRRRGRSVLWLSLTR